VGRELLKLGLVTKNAREQSELYLFHPSGHPLGLQTHEVDDRAHSFEFRPNMVYTNEPGIYVRKQDVVASDVFRKLSETEQQSVRAALDRYDGIGVRIEDDVLITTTEPKILSVAAPRSSADIEALMRRNATGRTPGTPSQRQVGICSRSPRRTNTGCQASRFLWTGMICRRTPTTKTTPSRITIRVPR
jgi:hypothetical protein